MDTVTIKGVTIGNGRPWIISPIIGRTRQQIIKKAEELTASPYVEFIEWRADCFENAANQGLILDTLQEIVNIAKSTPVIFAFRTQYELGRFHITSKDYCQLNESVAASGLADIIDIELFSKAAEAIRIEAIKKCGCFVMGSYHDVKKTPSIDEMVSKLRQLQNRGADILKLAVTPQTKQDVQNLLTATLVMHELYAQSPIVTLSMSHMGTISRMVGEYFGSSMTYGTIGAPSEEGQLSVETLNAVLNIVHSALTRKERIHDK